MATVALLVVVGAVVVVLDLDFDGIPLSPDPLGWALVVVAALRLRAPVLREGSSRAAARRQVGTALLVLAAISAVDGLLELVGVRPPAELASRPLALWDAALMVATVVVAVAFLRTVAAWAVDLGLGDVARQLRCSATAVGVGWGVVAVAVTVGSVVFDPGSVDVQLTGGTGLLLGAVVLGLFAILAYAGWSLLRLRGRLLRGGPTGPGSG